MVNVAFELGNQVKEDLEYSPNIDSIEYDSLLVMGMGGSGVSGDVLSLLSGEVSSKNIIVRKLRININYRITQFTFKNY